MRLIDSEALICELDDADLLTPDIMGIIESFDTIDAQPVVHGRWINDRKFNKGKSILTICSICHTGDKHSVNIDVPYCWNCGAKMDLGKEG